MTRRNALVGVIAMTVAAALVFAAVSAASGPDGKKQTSIAGSWMVDVDRPGLPPLKSLQSFARGGTLTEISNGGATVRSPSHGAWERIGERTYSGTLVFFRYDPQSGAYAGTVKIRHTLELSPDGRSFTGIAVAELRDPAGNLIPVPPRQDVVDGQRISVERLP